jgi:hypothetical protein
MAHFAELNGSNQVVRVVVVGNDIATANGPLGENDMHVDGETWCKNFFKGGTWKQTSYNNNFRKQYAGKGFTYDEAKDKFICPQPYSSWSLDENDDWQAPVARPTNQGDDEDNRKIAQWDDVNQQWIAETHYNEETNQYDQNWVWDTSTLTWVSA